MGIPKLDNCKTGNLENWETGKLENWKTGKLENLGTENLEKHTFQTMANLPVIMNVVMLGSKQNTRTSPLAKAIYLLIYLLT